MQGPAFKYDTAQFIVQEPVQFAGWKNFYHHDNEKGSMPTAAELMRLHPLPLYIQYLVAGGVRSRRGASRLSGHQTTCGRLLTDVKAVVSADGTGRSTRRTAEVIDSYRWARGGRGYYGHAVRTGRGRAPDALLRGAVSHPR
jgi:hypothetical protein